MQTMIEGYGGKYVYGPKDEYVAAAIGCEIRKWDTVVANARLIAAAPELLEALKETLVSFAGRIDNDQWCDYLREVIAKAEGRNSE